MRERRQREYDRPVMTPAGIMPGGSEMREWYGHIPFPSPAALTRKRAELLALIEERKAEKALTTPPVRRAS